MENKVEKILLKIFLVVAILIFTYLFLFSILFSYQNTDFIWEYVYKIVEFIPKQIAGVAIYSVFMLGVVHLLKKINLKDTRYFALVTAFLCTGISIYWIFTCGSTPGGDAGTLVRCTTQIAEGDYTSLQAGEYLGMWRNNLGTVTVLRIIFAIFGIGNYLPFRILNAIFVALLVYSGYKNVSILSNKNRIAEYTYLLLVLLCVPMYFYTPFVYGEIISTALLMFIFWMILEETKKWSWLKLVLIFLATFMAFMLRQNIIIAVIAIGGVIVVSSIIQKNKKWLLIVAITILACVLESVLMHAIYDKHIPEDSQPMPAIMWVSMGLNDDGVMSGWWNTESREIFQSTNGDPEASSEIAKELIKERWSNFLSNPVHLVRFYLKKISSQWLAPMYQCIYMNNVIDGSESKLAHEIYFNEKVNYGLSWIMNIYQIFIYGTGLIWFVKRFRNTGRLTDYIIPITVFGGFLFSIIWEGKARYIFPYSMMIMVLSAIGASYIHMFIHNQLEKKK